MSTEMIYIENTDVWNIYYEHYSLEIKISTAFQLHLRLFLAETLGFK